MKIYEVPELLVKRVDVCEEVLEKAGYDYLKKYEIETIDEEIIGNVYYTGVIDFSIFADEETELNGCMHISQDGTVYYHADGRKNGWTIETKDQKKWEMLADNGLYLFGANINLDSVEQIPDTYYINLSYKLPDTSWEIIGEKPYAHLIAAALEDFVDDVRSFHEEYNDLI
ncbi:MAG: hypothetical protein E7253_03575 [Lachnospiraceae bacterium]|nr:hypothetical protein [Lachnospiraceae bacterium]